MPVPERAFDPRPKSVLVATDFTATSEKPIRHAVGIARRYGAKLYIVHVVSSFGFTLAGPDSIASSMEAASRDAQILERKIGCVLNNLSYEIVIRRGNICEELENIVEKKNIDMIVVGTHGRRGLGKMLLGSIAEWMFHNAPCPVLIVGPGAFKASPFEHSEARPILLPVHFGAESLNAVPRAIRIANMRQTKLVLMHVVRVHDASSDRENTRQVYLQKLRDLIPPGFPLVIPPDFVVEFGTSSECILNVAKNLHAEMIVMGLRQTSHLPDSPWSTAYDVVCQACCPVMTMKS